VCTTNYNAWITQGIKISCERKRRLYIHTYKAVLYCKLLNKLIQQAKGQHYNRLIVKSYNKIKTTWNIMEQETEKILVHATEQMPSLLINDEKIKEPK
jgi:hypothetical protein